MLALAVSITLLLLLKGFNVLLDTEQTNQSFSCFFIFSSFDPSQPLDLFCLLLLLFLCLFSQQHSKAVCHLSQSAVHAKYVFLSLKGEATLHWCTEAAVELGDLCLPNCKYIIYFLI